MNRIPRVAVASVVAMTVLATTVVYVGSPSLAAPSRGCVATTRMRNLELADAPNSVVTTLKGRSKEVPTPVEAWSPKGDTVAYVAPTTPFGSVLKVRSVFSKKGTTVFNYIKRTTSPAGTIQIKFSPNGKRIAFALQRTVDGLIRVELWVVTLATKKAIRVSGPTQNVAGSFAWTPDSGTLVFGVNRAYSDLSTDDIDVYRAPATGGVPPARIIATAFNVQNQYPPDVGFVPPADIDDIEVSPDGKRLTFSGYDFLGYGLSTPDLWVSNIDGTGMRRIANNNVRGTSHEFPRWSPDSTRVAASMTGVGADRGFMGFVVIDVATTRTVKRFLRGSGAGTPAWSPDGTKVAFLIQPSRFDYAVETWVLDMRTMKANRIHKGPATGFGSRHVVEWVPCS